MNGCIYRTEENRCELHSSWCVIGGPCEERRPSNGDAIRRMGDGGLACFLTLVYNDAWAHGQWEDPSGMWDEERWKKWLSEGATWDGAK